MAASPEARVPPKATFRPLAVRLPIEVSPATARDGPSSGFSES
ncbi:hypothetical protein N806_01155 [Rhodococcus sp. P27]|nr:hypothetical protein N806_01155 [Rhodococcus sp. P27]